MPRRSSDRPSALRLPQVSMVGLQKRWSSTQRWAGRAGDSALVFVKDVGHGMLEVTHNTFALLGLIGVGLAIFLSNRPDVRQAIELRTFAWLEARHEAKEQTEAVDPLAEALSEPDAIARATATDPRELTRQQAYVAKWLAHRYRVAPEPVSRLVKEAWAVGAQAKLDPTLILAIMAIESSFNPFAESAMGAQGLMQVMTHVHDDKYVAFGGNLAAFDPVTNLRVGVQVLRDCITRAGGVEAGLRAYVGSANMVDDSGYASRVLAEQANLRTVAGGKQLAINTPLPARPAPSPKAASAVEPADEPTTADKSPAPEHLALLR